MKKYFIIFLAVAVMAAFAITTDLSAAGAKMIWKGDYQVVGVASDNVHDYDDDLADEVNHYTQRFRLMSIAATQYVKGIVGIEIGWDEWGKSYTDHGSNESPQGEINSQGGGDTGVADDNKPVNIELRFAYIDFAIPGTPVSVSVGKQAIWTHGFFIFSGALVPPALKITAKLSEEMKFVAWTVKHDEGKALSSNLRGIGDHDRDTYCAEFSMTTKAFNLGLYGVYHRDRKQFDSMTYYYLYAATYAATGDSDAAHAAADAAAVQTFDDDIYWIGLWGGAMAGIAKIDLDFIYAMGSRDYESGTGTDYDYAAYLVKLAVSTKISGISLMLSTLYTSGDDDSTDDEQNNFPWIQATTLYPSTGHGFPGPNLYQWGNGIAGEDFTWTGMWGQGHSEGIWLTNLTVVAPLIEKTKLVFKYWLMRVVEDPAQDYKDKMIGHEFDLELHYALSENLTVSGEVDYLLAGDYLASDDDGADSAWKAAWRVMYKF
ncbi:MAG: hypothetical protein SVR08_15415 [Spirochaetota bacterium]|nr:hypothetical protein [Spirochaetota bacterium]